MEVPLIIDLEEIVEGTLEKCGWSQLEAFVLPGVVEVLGIIDCVDDQVFVTQGQDRSDEGACRLVLEHFEVGVLEGELRFLIEHRDGEGEAESLGLQDRTVRFFGREIEELDDELELGGSDSKSKEARVWRFP